MTLTVFRIPSIAAAERESRVEFKLRMYGGGFGPGARYRDWYA